LQQRRIANSEIDRQRLRSRLVVDDWPAEIRLRRDNRERNPRASIRRRNGWAYSGAVEPNIGDVDQPSLNGSLFADSAA